MSKMDRDCPRYRREGRQIEDINGRTLPAEFRRPPSRPSPSKATLRQDGDALVAEFLKSKKVTVCPAIDTTRPSAPARRPNADRPVVKPTQCDEPPW